MGGGGVVKQRLIGVAQSALLNASGGGYGIFSTLGNQYFPRVIRVRDGPHLMAPVAQLDRVSAGDGHYHHPEGLAEGLSVLPSAPCHTYATHMPQIATVDRRSTTD